MKKTMSDYMSDSHTSGGHLSYLEDLYESYLQDPDSISEEWKAYFNDLPFQNGSQKNDNYEISKKGSYVEIIDFNNLPNGLLGISVKSINKVAIKDLTQLEDGLHIATHS